MQTLNKPVNGLDVDGLHALVEKVRLNPNDGAVGFEVLTQWKGGTRSETAVDAWTFGGEKLNRGFRLAIGEPVELGGDGDAPNPQEVLMAAVNACMMVGFVAVSAMKGIRLTSLEVETSGTLDLRGFLGIDPSVKPGYEEMRCTFHVKGDGTPEQFREVMETVKATSPNYWNVTQPIRLKPELVIENPSPRIHSGDRTCGFNDI